MTSGSNIGGRRASLVQIGSSLGVAGNCIGWLIFIMMCHGFAAAVNLALLPLLLGIAGMALTIVGANTQKHADIDTHVLASLFITLFAIVGGLFQVAIWLNWQFMPGMPGYGAGAAH
jgi:hypothetical protein